MAKMNYAKIMQTIDWIVQMRNAKCEIFANRSIGFVRLKLINLLNYRPRW